MNRSEQARALVEAGKTYSEAADAVGMSWQGVKTTCKRFGIEQTPRAAARAFSESIANCERQQRSKEVRAKLERMAAEAVAAGHTYSEVADMMDLTRNQVAGLLNRKRQRASP